VFLNPAFRPVQGCTHTNRATVRGASAILEDPGRSVGDISARRFNYQGAFLDNEYNERIMGIGEESLRNAQNVLSIAAGPHKVLSIIGALRLNIITHFVTDENTAKTILSLV
jgi:DNA-binding transcriptional regulator LsrR (DeoR family)